MQAIGKAPESYTYEIEGDTLTLTDTSAVSISLVKQATLDKPANSIPTVTIDGGDGMAVPGSQVSFTTTADPSDASQDLAYQWYVNNALQDGETADTFTYDVPASGTIYTIEVAVSDGFDVVADSIELTLITPSSEIFEHWDGDSWEPLGVNAPEGALDAFSYNDKLTVRFANNDLWTYTGGAWSELGTSASTGTIQATSIDSSMAGRYLLTRDASGVCTVYDGSTWMDCSALYPALPSGTVDFVFGGSSLIAVLDSGAAQHSETIASPFADYVNQPGGAVEHIGIGDYGSTPVVLAANDAGALFTGDDPADPTWTAIGGVTVPSDAVDVFLYGGSITIRR